ncbi:MAG: hypothetical protein KJ607_06080 [Bacteroidetes bacterium]|nr:hypothetical protein [Bacteroidota bacterium]
MKRTIAVFQVFAILFALTVYSVQAQQKNTILVAGQENFFEAKDGRIQCRFTLKGPDAGYNFKPATEIILSMPGVVKFGIKNQTGEKYDERECFLVLEQGTYLNLFPQVMRQLYVEKVKVAGTEKNVKDFVDSYR